MQIQHFMPLVPWPNEYGQHHNYWGRVAHIFRSRHCCLQGASKLHLPISLCKILTSSQSSSCLFLASFVSHIYSTQPSMRYLAGTREDKLQRFPASATMLLIRLSVVFPNSFNFPFHVLLSLFCCSCIIQNFRLNAFWLMCRVQTGLQLPATACHLLHGRHF